MDLSTKKQEAIRFALPLIVVVVLLAQTVIPVFALVWTSQTSGTTLDLFGIAHDGSRFVVVGGGLKILTSPDGITWTSQTPGTSAGLLSNVVHYGSQFVAVGSSGEILTSPGGTTWTSQTSGTTELLFRISHDGSQFVVVGLNGTILTSLDGTTWTSQTSGTSVNLYGIAHDGSQIVVVGFNGTILTSLDSATWIPQTSGTTHDLLGVVHDGSQFVAVGVDTILTSPDGTAWTSQTPETMTTQLLFSVGHNSSQFLAVGTTGSILISPNGITWTVQTSGTTEHLQHVAHNGSQFVVVGRNGTILTSGPVTTTAVSNTTQTTTNSGGNVIRDGGSAVTARGVCWSTSISPTTADNTTTDGTGTGTFTSALTGLTPGTTYYVRAYARNSAGTFYGEQITFTALKAPTVTTQDVSDIYITTATANGNITDLGISNPTQHGVCWSTSENPTTLNNKTEDGAANAIGAFTCSITGLAAGSTYYVRAYATNSAGTSYGEQVTFTADDGDGVTASEESGPDGNDPSYSGNSDAIPDSTQSFVASMHTNDGNNYVTLICPDNQSLVGVTALANPHPTDSPVIVTFPYQFFEFTISGVGNGGATTLTIDLPAGSTVAETYWKYGPTPTNNLPHWYEFMYDSTTATGAVITGNQIVLHFVDGQRGDDDLTANGSIVDQGGPGTGNGQIPTLNEWGMIIMGLLFLGFSFWIMKRKEQNNL